MKISEVQEIPANATTTYQLLTDPDVLIRTVPGMNSLKLIEDHVYEAQLELGIKMVKGCYKGTVKLADAVEGEQFRLIMEGQGPLGFVKMNVFIQLEEISDNQTNVNCNGDAAIGGVVAAIGDRMMSSVASLLMKQFFKALKEEAIAV